MVVFVMVMVMVLVSIFCDRIDRTYKVIALSGRSSA